MLLYHLTYEECPGCGEIANLICSGKPVINCPSCGEYLLSVDIEKEFTVKRVLKKEVRKCLGYV